MFSRGMLPFFPEGWILFAPAVILSIALPIAAAISLLLIYQGSRKKPFKIIWTVFSIVSLLLIVVAQINSGVFYLPYYISMAYIFTGILSLILCIAMLIVIHVIKPKKNTQDSELKKMNIQNLE